jgi:hypothetical protein
MLLFILFLFCSTICAAQKVDDLKKKDSLPAATVDSMIKAEHSPKKAAVRSAVIPGWGQSYNKKYWKIPIIYAALGITTYIFIDNLTTYQDYRLAYKGKYMARVNHDSTYYKQMDPIYIPVSEESLRQGRDQFRMYIDYTAAVFLVFWGLNIIDAVVDAHLKTFDVSPDLSLKVKPSYNPIAKTGRLSLVFSLK